MANEEINESKLLLDFFRSNILKICTSLVGQVVSFDAEKNTVDVQVVTMRKMKGKPVDKLPVIKNCPVMFYGGGDFVITFEPKAGDVCDLVFNGRSLERWKLTGGIVDPADPRHHDLTDAKAYFGLNSYDNAFSGIKPGLELRNRSGTTSIYLAENGIEIKIGGTVVAELAASGITLNVPISGPSATFGGKVVESHTHGGVQTGGGNTAGPN